MRLKGGGIVSEGNIPEKYAMRKAELQLYMYMAENGEAEKAFIDAFSYGYRVGKRAAREA